MSEDDVFVDKSGRIRKRKTACKHGHPFDGTEKWSVNWRGYRCRVCRVCARERMARKRINPERKRLDREKTARWRAADKDRARATAKRAYQKRNRWIQAFKKQCKYCPESRFPCLDFHHRESGEKTATIGQVRHWSHERLAAEIEKCDIVCANCHRWLHWQETQAEFSEGD